MRAKAIPERREGRAGDEGGGGGKEKIDSGQLIIAA